MFNDHYPEWNKNRLKVIYKHYDKNFFKDKNILEVGCGHAFFSEELKKHGANVTASDAREEYLKKISDLKTICHNLDNEWNIGTYDVIIHFGVLYHLKNPKKALVEAISNSKLLFLESEVLDTMEDEIIFRSEDGYDQGIDNIGNQMSVGAIEKIITETGKKFARLDDPDLNSSFHYYNWPVGNNKNWIMGRRKFWIIS